MLEQDLITPSKSPWSSPITLVKKKDSSYRFCIDYHKLNEVTSKDSFPLPRIDDSLDALGGNKYFSVMDLSSGYWQVGVHPDDRTRRRSLPLMACIISRSCHMECAIREQRSNA